MSWTIYTFCDYCNPQMALIRLDGLLRNGVREGPESCCVINHGWRRMGKGIMCPDCQKKEARFAKAEPPEAEGGEKG